MTLLCLSQILTCEDKELNQWVSLKKSVQYRTDEEERRDRQKYRKKARDHAKKLRILHSLQEYVHVGSLHVDSVQCTGLSYRQCDKWL